MKSITGAILVLASAVFQLVSNTEDAVFNEVCAAIVGWIVFALGLRDLAD